MHKYSKSHEIEAGKAPEEIIGADQLWFRNKQGKFDVGLDVGSVSVNLVIMNPGGEVVKEVYRRFDFQVVDVPEDDWRWERRMASEANA